MDNYDCTMSQIKSKGEIRFGLVAVKGMGAAAADFIIKERETNGRYSDIYDFFSRINYTIVNKKSLESLVYSGAFDSLIEFRRGCFFARPTTLTYLEMLINYGQKAQQEKGSMQQSLFDMFDEKDAGILKPKAPAYSEGTVSSVTISTRRSRSKISPAFCSIFPLFFCWQIKGQLRLTTQ